MTVTAAYTDAQGGSESVASTATAAVANVNDAPTGSVTIAGSVTEGQILTAANTLADEDGMGTVTYTWSNGAQGTTVTLAQSDVGNAMTVTAAYTDGEGTAESVTSSATAAVSNINAAPTGSVTITGTVAEDQVLTAANTLADEDGMGTVCLLYTSPSPRDRTRSRMPSSA